MKLWTARARVDIHNVTLDVSNPYEWGEPSTLYCSYGYSGTFSWRKFAQKLDGLMKIARCQVYEPEKWHSDNVASILKHFASSQENIAMQQRPIGGPYEQIFWRILLQRNAFDSPLEELVYAIRGYEVEPTKDKRYIERMHSIPFGNVS